MVELWLPQTFGSLVSMAARMQYIFPQQSADGYHVGHHVVIEMTILQRFITQNALHL